MTQGFSGNDGDGLSDRAVPVESQRIHTAPDDDRDAEIAALKAALARREADDDSDDGPQDGAATVDELAIEREVRKGHAKATLAGRTVLVPPIKTWRSSAMKALNAGDFETWAEKVLDDEAWEVWEEVDPSIDQIDEFFGSFSDQIGIDRGNSRASRRSSRTTRGR